MKKNQIGTTDMYVSEIALGCMSLGKNKQTAKNMINDAIDAGINYLDTADLYDFGENEEIIGSVIKHRRHDIILSTKVGNHFNKETGKWFWDPSKNYIEKAVKSSLRRLKTDYIDLYLLHGGTINDPMDESIEAFENLKKEGIIRAYGVSSIRPNVIREYVKRSTIDAVMMQYSLLDRRPEEEMLALLKENNISVLVRGTLAKGILSNQAEEQIEAKGLHGYLDYTFDELKCVYQNLTKTFKNKYVINELAQKYVLYHPSVTTTVLGASSLKQLSENVKMYGAPPITKDQYQALQKMTKRNLYKDHRD